MAGHALHATVALAGLYWRDMQVPQGPEAAHPSPEAPGALHAGEVRHGGSYVERMSRVRVSNTIMDDHNYLARRWREFLDA